MFNDKILKNIMNEQYLLRMEFQKLIGIVEVYLSPTKCKMCNGYGKINKEELNK